MQIKCLDSLPMHLPRTYHDVGEFACGQVGRAMVSAVTTLEYFGYACMQLILLWHQLEVGTPSSALLACLCCSASIVAQGTALSPCMLLLVDTRINCAGTMVAVNALVGYHYE